MTGRAGSRAGTCVDYHAGVSVYADMPRHATDSACAQTPERVRPVKAAPRTLLPSTVQHTEDTDEASFEVVRRT